MVGPSAAEPPVPKDNRSWAWPARAVSTPAPTRGDLQTAASDVVPEAQLAAGVLEGPVCRRLSLCGPTGYPQQFVHDVAPCTDRHAGAVQGGMDGLLVGILSIAQAKCMTRQPGGP